MAEQAKRYDVGKPKLEYLFTWRGALSELAQVCMKGEEKYERGNYLRGQPYSQLLNSATRHLFKFGDPNTPDTDEESGRHHIAHAIWNLLQLLEHEQAGRGDEWDDRLRKP